MPASGSSSFNIGAANYALDQRAKVIYLVNVSSPSAALGPLISKGLNIIKVIFGPEAIPGSTRLNAASGDYIVLSLILEAVAKRLRLSNLTSDELDRVLLIKAKNYLKDLVKVNQYISDNLSNYAKITNEMVDVLNNNYYITYIADDSIVEVLNDVTELHLTFSLPGLQNRNEKSDVNLIEPIRAYFLGAKTNLKVWENICRCKLDN